MVSNLVYLTNSISLVLFFFLFNSKIDFNFLYLSQSLGYSIPVYTNVDLLKNNNRCDFRETQN